MARKRSASQLFGAVGFGNVPTSVHNLSCDRYFTTHPGQVRPVWYRFTYPRDRFVIHPRLTVSTFPTTIESFARFDARVDYFYVPLTAFYGWLHNNSQMSFSDWNKAPRWRFEVLSVAENQSSFEGFYSYPGQKGATYGVGSLFDHLGYPTIAQKVYETSPTASPTAVSINVRAGGMKHEGDSFLAFWAIYREFFMNPQADTFPVTTNTVTEDFVTEFSYTQIQNKTLDRFMAGALALSPVADQAGVNGVLNTARANLSENAGLIFGNNSPTNAYAGVASFVNVCRDNAWTFDGAIPLCTYGMDFFRGRLGSDASFSTSASVENSSVTVNNIRFANKVQKFAEKFILTRGRFADWMRVVWGVRTSTSAIPQYLGGFSKEINFAPTVQTSSTPDNGSPLGWTISNGYARGGARPISVRCSTYGIIMAISTIRPRVVYGQIAWPEDTRVTFGDLFAPDMANLGYQPISDYYLTGGVSTSSVPQTQTTTAQVAGYQISWVDLMTDVDRSYGLFREPFSLAAMLPSYIPSSLGYYPDNDGRYYLAQQNDTTYVYPNLWNRFFDDTSATGHNFRCTLSQDIRARRAIPYRTMPSL